MATQATVESVDLAAVPGAPAEGQCWIVAAGAAGDWAGQADAIAGWTANGWRFMQPGAGWRAFVADRGHVMRYDGGGWIDENGRSDGCFVGGHKVVGVQQGAIPNPAGGATVDSEARAALVAILAALRMHGLIAT